MPNDRAKRRGRDSLATETKSTTRVRLSAGLGSGAGGDAAPATGQKTPAGHSARTQSVDGRGENARPACATQRCSHGGPGGNPRTAGCDQGRSRVAQTDRRRPGAARPKACGRSRPTATCPRPEPPNAKLSGERSESAGALS
jgi:hypothetical protein